MRSVMLDPIGLRVAQAHEADVADIVVLLAAAAPDTIALSHEEVRRHLQTFEVVRDRSGRAVASAAVRPIGRGRAELRSVAVHDDHRGEGLGSLLVQRAAERAADEGLRLVCVTRARKFFDGLGFARIPMTAVPPKPGAPARPSSSATDRPRVAMAYLNRHASADALVGAIT